MRLQESEKQNPQDYFLDDGAGNFTLLHRFIDNYLPNKAIRKKVFDGEADIVISADTIHIYWKGELIAQAQLEGQVEVTPDNWQGQLNYQDYINHRRKKKCQDQKFMTMTQQVMKPL
jgi:hypothetical protein